ncbi:hypothetical protein C8R48DRAFT_667717 [Suillus tomentosus]|nr:hypothetical protein C8R48DRAFT_667717 [Suillus tomentosus]
MSYWWKTLVIVNLTGLGQSGHRESISKLTQTPTAVTVGFDVPALTPSLKNSSNDEQNGQDGTHSAEEPASNTPLLTEEASTSVMLDEHDYEPYNVSNFGAPTELLPSASTPAAAAATSSTINHASTSISHATHKDLGSGLPRGLPQAFRSTLRFSSSRLGFNMLVKQKHNPWDRK